MTDTLETPRLTLRRFADCEADAQLLFELDSDPEVMRYVGPSGLSTVEAGRELIRNRIIPSCVAGTPRGGWAAYRKPAGEFIGWFFLRSAPASLVAAEAGWTRPTDLEVGYRLRRAAWGRGLATEGASFLVERGLADPTVTCVLGVVSVANLASCRVLEKCGLARYREFVTPRFVDPEVLFARCRDGCATRDRPGLVHSGANPPRCPPMLDQLKLLIRAGNPIVAIESRDERRRPNSSATPPRGCTSRCSSGPPPPACGAPSPNHAETGVKPGKPKPALEYVLETRATPARSTCSRTSARTPRIRSSRGSCATCSARRR